MVTGIQKETLVYIKKFNNEPKYCHGTHVSLCINQGQQSVSVKSCQSLLYSFDELLVVKCI